MADVVALALPGGPAFVDALKRVWEAGDAAFPVDPRLPPAELERVMATVAPSSVIEGDGEPRSLDGGRPVEAGDALVMATSGTTGEPKGVILTHSAVAASAEATSARLGVDPARHTWLACLPLAHVGGLSVVTRALHTGAGLMVHERFDPAAVAAAAAAGATHVSLVTRALTRIDAESFEAILIGGAAPPPDRPPNVIATYGMTETGSGVVYERAPLDGIEFAVDNTGEIRLRGPMLLRAYRTTDGEVDPKVDGWFATGDIGSIDADGRVMVEGRRAEVITTGGEKVWPTRVEAVLASLDAVAEAAVIGVADPEWGRRVVALVVAADGAEVPSLDEARAAVRAVLPVWYAPTEIRAVASLPRTPLGKLRRSAL